MKVIGAGFGRTGTLSLKVALEELGFGPCYHMVELFDKPEHVEFWDEAADRVARGEPVEWGEVFSGYEATVDWPACIFYEELMAAYPEAKVLLTVRDPESWYDSAESTIARMPGSDASSPLRYLLFKSVGLLVPAMRRAPSMARKVISEGTFDGRFEEREYSVKVFERHIEEVRERVPEERLLVYEVGEGWEPLCEFLGVEAPDRPFPRLNDRAGFPRMMRRHMMKAIAPAIGKVAAAVALVFAASLALRLAYRSPGMTIR
jgi:Sulfotransferase domain